MPGHNAPQTVTPCGYVWRGMSIVSFDFADPEYEASFRSYSNYLADLAGVIGGLYGWDESLVAGVHAGVASHPPLGRVQRRTPDERRQSAIEKALNKSWGHLHRGWLELEDPDEFDAEINALLPTQAYYAIYHAIRAFALASNQDLKPDHRSALNLIAKAIKEQNLLPYPWSAACVGCPNVDAPTWVGFPTEPQRVHSLSRPDPDTSGDRLAMFLRTTREHELERRYDDERHKNVSHGRSRRNITKSNKRSIADRLAPTTIFDTFWRLRKKADYEDAEVFVLGAMGDADARRFAESLHIVTDATVAALEVAVAAYVGPNVVSAAASSHALRKRRVSPKAPISRRSTSWTETPPKSPT